MDQLIRLVRRNPAVAVGVAAFAGLALGAGWVPIPSLRDLLPARPTLPAAAPAAPPPPPDPLDQY